MHALAQEGCPAVKTIEERLRIAYRTAVRKREIRVTHNYGSS
jgi:hypothetical protein